MRSRLSLTALLVAATALSQAQENTAPLPPTPPLTVQALAESVRASLVTINPAGRDGEPAGVGSGFVISEDGLIATNLHVIGEGRGLRVEFADGSARAVTEIFAWDRERDLAILRVENAAGLKPLPLGDSATAAQGEPVVAMGNPLGFRNSVVEGVLSAVREVDGRDMLQLAMPVERGNSGGPVLNRRGEVLGVVTLKSAVTANLGFAMPVNELKHVRDHPSPVAMRRWLTIGALNPKIWRPLGARWTQRAGVLRVRESGGGFGGRALCESLQVPPAPPYEISVRVKLGDESGAAGLSFCGDGGDIHYGFYPSAGQLRLTRFNGPDVYSWTILNQVTAPSYRPGEWNLLRVRVEPDRIICKVNGETVIDSPDAVLRAGAVGLCSFRGTEAEFREFRIDGPDGAAPSAEADAARAAVTRLAAGEADAPELRAALESAPDAARAAAETAAAALEKRAATLREAANEAASAAVARRLAVLLTPPDGTPPPLAEAALTLARLDNPDLDPAPYLEEIDRMAADLRDSLTDAERADPRAALARLNRWMFEENGFRGSRDDFNSRSNSYLNEVIDDREGLPITLAVLHMELARRIGLDVTGVGLPLRFMNRLTLPGGDAANEPHAAGPVYIDVYDRGRLLTKGEAAALIQELSGAPPDEASWKAATPAEIIRRMLNNLTARAAEDTDAPRLLRYVGAALALDPGDIEARLRRAFLHASAGRNAAAIEDARYLLDHHPEAPGADRLREMIENLSR